MTTVFEGAIGRLRIGEARLFVDNQSRFRSGHMRLHGARVKPKQIANEIRARERLGKYLIISSNEDIL